MRQNISQSGDCPFTVSAMAKAYIYMIKLLFNAEQPSGREKIIARNIKFKLMRI
jgi:hypothetical protein